MASSFFTSLAAIARRALSVIACDKDSGDGEEIFLELGDVALSIGSSLLDVVENHEADAALPQHVLDEVKGDSTEPITVGNNNFFEFSAHRPVQNGDETPALEVDTRRNIRNDLVLGIETNEGFALPDEVGLLLFARDAGVDDLGACFRGEWSRFDLHAERLPDVWQAVESLAPIADADAADGALVGEPAECVVADAVGGPDAGGSDIWSTFFFIFVHKSLILLPTKYRMNKNDANDAIYNIRHTNDHHPFK